jgi:hypothetical protein
MADQEAVREALQEAESLARQRQSDKYGGSEVILGRSLEELQALVAASGQPTYRAKQLRDGVMQGAKSIADITTIPKVRPSLRFFIPLFKAY